MKVVRNKSNILTFVMKLDFEVTNKDFLYQNYQKYLSRIAMTFTERHGHTCQTQKYSVCHLNRNKLDKLDSPGKASNSCHIYVYVESKFNSAWNIDKN
jgi:hypothetical protein